MGGTGLMCYVVCGGCWGEADVVGGTGLMCWMPAPPCVGTTSLLFMYCLLIWIIVLGIHGTYTYTTHTYFSSFH